MGPDPCPPRVREAPFGRLEQLQGEVELSPAEVPDRGGADRECDRVGLGEEQGRFVVIERRGRRDEARGAGPSRRPADGRRPPPGPLRPRCRGAPRRPSPGPWRRPVATARWDRGGGDPRAGGRTRRTAPSAGSPWQPGRRFVGRPCRVPRRRSGPEPSCRSRPVPTRPPTWRPPGRDRPGAAQSPPCARGTATRRRGEVMPMPRSPAAAPPARSRHLITPHGHLRASCRCHSVPRLRCGSKGLVGRRLRLCRSGVTVSFRAALS